VLFSEPKIPQSGSAALRMPDAHGFSALQRAENSSIALSVHPRLHRPRFQCSSASRKFLTTDFGEAVALVEVVSVLFSEPKIPHAPPARPREVGSRRFSALQRAENSSPPAVEANPISKNVSVLFSEPKIPHRPASGAERRRRSVSVLFSEPKIPH